MCGDKLCPVQEAAKYSALGNDFNVNNSFSRPASGQCR